MVMAATSVVWSSQHRSVGPEENHLLYVPNSSSFTLQHKSQFGDDGSEFDLLAITPTKGDRRPKRQTMSTGKK